MKILALVLLLALGSKASAVTVQELLPECRQIISDGPVTDYFAAGRCLGLIAGTSQVMAFNCSERQNGVGINPRLAAVLPPSHGAGAQAFVNWATDNPQAWGMDGTLGVMSALAATFPCE